MWQTKRRLGRRHQSEIDLGSLLQIGQGFLEDSIAV